MSISIRVLSLALAGIVMQPAASAAQTASTVTFGVKAGVNSSNIKFSDSADQETKSLVGAVGGLFLGKQINDNVGVQIEGLFSQKGAKDATSGSDAKFRLTYIDVPVLLRFDPTTTNETRFHVFTGPQLSFKTKAEGTEDGQTFDLDSEIESTDFGWVLGAGVERSRFSLDVRYALGLKDIATDSEKAKNRVFSVMMGVKLR
jgi:opacity protein-like surface antigen